jgi:hypothetical protein
MRLLKALPGLLFGLIFLGAGLFFMWQFAGTTFVSWQTMQGWQTSQAQLLEVSGSNNQAHARYRYEVSGVFYESQRVSVTEFNDNIGDYQDKLTWRLSKMHQAGQAISIWVNPLDPTQAVIDRNMRWGLFAFMVGFCSIFVLIGLFIVIMSIKPSNTSAKQALPNLKALRKEWEQTVKSSDNKETFVEYRQRRIQQNNQQQVDSQNQANWKNRKGWQQAKIKSNARNAVWINWGFAIFVNAFFAPFALDIPREIAKGNYAMLLVLVFALVGVLLIYRAIKSTLEYQRFGKVVFEMDPYPGAIGGHVGGHVLVPKLAYELLNAPNASCSVRLECVYSYVSGSGDNRSRQENIRWAQQGEPKVKRRGSGVALGFRFDVPDHLPSSDVEQKTAYNFWRLTIKADIKGVDLNREYNLPVFKGTGTIKTSRHVRHDISAQHAQQKQIEDQVVERAISDGDLNIKHLSRAMKHQEMGNALLLSFPMFRNKLLVVFAAIFAGGFGFASVSMITSALGGGWAGILMGLFCLPFLLVALVSAVAFIYMAFNNLRVRVSEEGVSVLRRILFIPIYSRVLSSQQIARLISKRTGSTGQGVDKIEHFKILAEDNQGKTFAIAEDIDGEPAAQHFKDYLEKRLGLETKPLSNTRSQTAL